VITNQDVYALRFAIIAQRHLIKVLQQLVDLDLREIRLVVVVRRAVAAVARRLHPRVPAVVRLRLARAGIELDAPPRLPAGHARARAGLRLGRGRLVQVDRAAHLGVLLELAEEELVVLVDLALVAPAEAADDAAAVLRRVGGLLRHAAQAPRARAALLAPVRVRLADEDDVGDALGGEGGEVVRVEVGVREVEAERGVARLEDRAEVRARVEDLRGRGGERGVVERHELVVVVVSAATAGAEGARERDLRVGEDELAARGPRGLDVEHGELDELRHARERVERRAPVGRRGELGELECLRVGEVERVADAGAEDERGDVAERARELGGQADEVVLADRRDLDRVRELVVGRVRVRVHGDELRRRLDADGDDRGEELGHLDRVAALAIEKVEPVARLLDGDGVLLDAVLEDELLEEEEGPLVRDLLSDLDDRFPRVLGGEAGTVQALGVLDQELDLEYLFEDGGSQNLCTARCE
jgi:hypothetical protein